MSHVRIITQRASRRIMGSRGQSHTLCGAPMTDRDLSPADARRTADPHWRSQICPQCLTKLS